MSEKLLIALTSTLVKYVESTTESAQKQREYKLNQLRNEVNKTKNASQNSVRRLEVKLPTAIKIANENLLKELIPVLDAFESQINNVTDTLEVDNLPTDVAELYQSLQHAQQQLMDSLDNHGLKPIDARGKIFNPDHHEEIQPPIYSDDVPVGRVIKEEKRGYLLHDQIIRKTQVTISKKKQQVDILLNEDFAQPIRFVTYAAIRDLTDIETSKDEIKGITSRGEEEQLQKLNILFAFPKEDMAALQPHIKQRLHIANQNLQPTKLISERLHIADDVLKPLLVKPEAMESNDLNRIVQLVTRSGYILNGYLWDFDKDCLYMSINEKVVVVYRPGILDLKARTWNKIIKAYKDGNLVTGHILKTIKNGLCVKFGSLYGFLPKSEVELTPVQNLHSYIGKTFKMKIVKLSKTVNNIDIVLSRRAYLEIEHVEETVDSPQISEESTGILKPQIQELIQETLKTNSPREPLETVNDNSHLTPQKYNEILQTHIQLLKPALPEENIDLSINTSNNISDQLTESIQSESPEKTSNSSSNIEISNDEEPSTDEIQRSPKKP